MPPLFRALAPRLTPADRQVVDSMLKLVSFLTGNLMLDDHATDSSFNNNNNNNNNGGAAVSLRLGLSVVRPENREKLLALLPTLREFAPNIREFGGNLVRKLALKATARVVRATSAAIFGDNSVAQRNVSFV